MNEPILKVEKLEKSFPTQHNQGFFRKGTPVRVLCGIDLEVMPGETVGLVGESGCGKSTLARCVLRLLEPSAGKVHFRGEDILNLSASQLRSWRKKCQMIFQDPYSALNPRMTIGSILSEPLKIHTQKNRQEISERVSKLLDDVGLHPEMADRYPHEFSGGQRQRVGIARALALNPDLIIADEPVSALDVSVQAQILNLLQDLQKQYELSYLFIAHDLKVVERLSNRIAVMYLGKIVEKGSAHDIVQNPMHPYTKALLDAVPTLEKKKAGHKVKAIKGDVPSLNHPPSGCRFHPRCPIAEERCKSQEPPLEAKGRSNGHHAACWLV